MSSNNAKREAFVSAAIKYNESVVAIDLDSVTKIDLHNIAESAGLKFPHWITRDKNSPLKVGRGLWKIPVNGSVAVKSSPSPKKKVEKVVAEPVFDATPIEVVPDVDTRPIVKESSVVEMTKGTTSTVTNIPSKDPLFVPFGNFSDVNSIFKSNMFYPIYVTGLSGNGKTFMIEQAAAKAGRELFRVNITVETDEDDLLGGFRLVDGETVWFDGPVVEAMRKGAIVLLDEGDLASTKIMCLQPVLEGKGVFLKKINEFVECADGFNVVATANTKGKGDETGNFMGAGVLNEAFLERFPITVEQEYPSNSVEKKILNKVFDKLNINDSEFVDKLINWADVIRKTYVEGAIDQLITTRRLVHISNAYAIFNMDRMKAISMCVNRFDDETKMAMIDLYTKIDSGVDAEATATATEEEGDNACPF